jgi:hypothetical protein
MTVQKIIRASAGRRIHQASERKRLRVIGLH